MKKLEDFNKYEIFKKPNRRVHTTFIHCSWSDHKHHTIADVWKWHVIDNGWKDIGYHYFIDFDGEIWEGRPLHKAPAAQARNNRGTIAVCVHGGQNDKPDAFTKKQYEALKKISRDIDEAYAGNMRFRGHTEVAAKQCPVFDYKSTLGLDAKGGMIEGVPTEKKLVTAGSRIAKQGKANKDAGAVLVSTGVAGGAAQLAPPDLETAKNVVDTAFGWQTVVTKGATVINWGLANIWIILIVVGGVLYWRNRNIINATISDRIKAGVLRWQSD